MEEETVNYNRAIVKLALRNYGFPFREYEVDENGKKVIVIPAYLNRCDMEDGEPILTFNIRPDGQVLMNIENRYFDLKPREQYEVNGAIWDIIKGIKVVWVLYKVGDVG
jgi:hypothetical protein